jgi:bifunctional DNase/RNase
MFKIRIFDISLTKAGFVLFLSENEAGPVLPIVIGISEAQSITMALNKVQAERPLSHDLFKTIMDNFQATVIKVIVSKYENGTFFADLYMSTNDGTLILDARPSDAIALAIRYNSPIYVKEAIMDEAGVFPAASAESSGTKINHAELELSPVSEVTILETRLDDAVKGEKYEEAAVLRDQLNRLKSSD